MKEIGRILSALLALALIVCVFASCGKEDQEQNTNSTVTTAANQSETEPTVSPAETDRPTSAQASDQATESAEPSPYIPPHEGSGPVEVGGTGDAIVITW